MKNIFFLWLSLILSVLFVSLVCPVLFDFLDGSNYKVKFINVLFFSLFFGIVILLPYHKYFRVKKKDNFINIIFVISVAYGLHYFLFASIVGEPIYFIGVINVILAGFIGNTIFFIAYTKISETKK